MQIVDNRALVLRTRNPGKYAVIPKHKIVSEDAGTFEIAVYWGLDETRVLRNLGVKNAPSPITRRYDWPGRYTPMQHQIETASFLTLYRRAFCFSEPGTGKTLAALWAADYLMRRGDVRRVLILCPLSIMHSAWMGDIGSSIIHRSAVVAHHSQASRRVEMIQKDYEIVIANYDGLNLIAQEVINDGRFDLVIVDECFVAGTNVLTPAGPRPIEKLTTGDTVLTSNGRKRIKRLVRNTATRLVRVRTSDGKEIVCTPDHPFFTDAGWVTAENLGGRRLVLATELPALRGGISGAEVEVGVAPTARHEHGADLLEILRTEEVPRAESGGELLQSDGALRAWQPNGDNAHARATGAPVAGGEGQWAQTQDAWGQRHGHDADGEAGVGGAFARVAMELPSSVGRQAAKLSYELQARLRAAAHETGAGDRRGQPHVVGAQGAGPQEGGQVGGTWVESVSPVEQGSGTPVFNLEVEGTPNYFVEGCIVHNCNAYKNPSTRRWKALASIIKPETYLWMLTGTPAAQSPVDAYGLAKLVNPGGVPKFFTAWRDKVMNKITMFKWAPKPDATATVYSALQPAIRFTKAQCLDLPPVVTVTREVPMTPQQNKYYKMLKEQMLIHAAGETISAVNAGVVINKLLQISCGAAYSDDKEVIEFDASPRLHVLDEILEETQRKVIVFALYRSSIDAIVLHLQKQGVAVDTIHGDVSATKRGRIINDFQTTSLVRVLVLQPQATAHGITLTAADTVVFYGPLMSVEMYTQCIARADRKGQDSDKVTVVHIESSPIEKKLFKAMTTKVSDHALLVGMFDSEIKNL